ncbi:MAG TPA: hypothetical protein V6D29_15825 [Leptolyngbyaceae cyanobacterium]
MRAPVLALCSVAAFTALRPAEKVYVVASSETDASEPLQNVGIAGEDAIELKPSARYPQPDAFIYEFLRSEELASIDLFANQSAISTKPKSSGPATAVSFDPFSQISLASAGSSSNRFNIPRPKADLTRPLFSIALRTSS